MSEETLECEKLIPISSFTFSVADTVIYEKECYQLRSLSPPKKEKGRDKGILLQALISLFIFKYFLKHYGSSKNVKKI